MTNGFTAKEMWVRVDGKLDAVLAKQSHYDIELALVKARVEEQEREARENRDEMRKSVETIRMNQQSVGSLIKWAAAIIGALVVASDALVRFFAK